MLPSNAVGGISADSCFRVCLRSRFHRCVSGSYDTNFDLYRPAVPAECHHRASPDLYRSAVSTERDHGTVPDLHRIAVLTEDHCCVGLDLCRSAVSAKDCDPASPDVYGPDLSIQSDHGSSTNLYRQAVYPQDDSNASFTFHWSANPADQSQAVKGSHQKIIERKRIGVGDKSRVNKSRVRLDLYQFVASLANIY